MSPIHSFQNEDMYSPQYSKDMYQNIAHEESPDEVTTPPMKPSGRRQKRMDVVQNEDVPQCTTWTNEGEIMLCKGWVHESKNSAKGNAKKTDGFGLSKTFGSSSFNTESKDASLNLNVDAKDGDEKKVLELPRPIGRDKLTKGSKKKRVGSSGSLVNMTNATLVRLMVSELAT
nr:hypothetical protein [Tanacetum cinerariifolium]